MSIDNCKYSFAQLATDVFPKYMEVLRSGFDSPTPMSVFPEKETGIANILRNLNLEADFQGCYVLLNNSRPVYVGISQSVIQRLRQHVRGTTQFDASLAYRIATKRNPHSMSRSEAMAKPLFRGSFEKAQDYVHKLNVVFIKIHNALELYLFEVYCLM